MRFVSDNALYSANPHLSSSAFSCSHHGFSQLLWVHLRCALHAAQYLQNGKTNVAFRLFINAGSEATAAPFSVMERSLQKNCRML